MNDVEKILEWIRTVEISTLPFNVVSIGWGPKIKDGVETGENCVIFTVSEKKDIANLLPSEIIPDNISIDFNDLIVQANTDVVEPLLCEKLPTCNTNSNTVDPVRQHRLRRRPLMGGIETMTDWGNYVGTLGLLVRDKTDGSVVALSNNHVFANSQVSAIFNTPNDLGSTTTTEISAFQPTGFYKTTPQNDFIGKCKRAVLIGNINPDLRYDGATPYGAITETSCDAAILQLSGYNLIDSINSPNVLNFNQLAPYKFATDSEIDSIAPGGSNEGAPIFRSGRTLGAFGFPGNSSSICSLSVYKLDWALVGNYSGYVSYFSNCFYVRGSVDPGAGGDSGSAMFALFNRNNPSLSAWKCIGLLFAGPNDNSYTIGCRITEIANALQIIPWNTRIPTLTSIPTFYKDQTLYSQTVTLSGRLFFQIGYE